MKNVCKSAKLFDGIVSKCLAVHRLIMVFALFQGLAAAEGALTNGGNHSDTIGTAGETDIWTFQANKDDAISLSIGEVLIPEIDPGFWPWIELVGPDASPQGSSFGALAAQIHLSKAPLTGTYTVRVSSNDSRHAATGSYVLTLARTPGAFIVSQGDQGGAVTNGQNHPGTISRGDLDMWSFQAAKDDAISLSIAEVLPPEVDPGFWPWIKLRGPDGALLGESFGALAAQVHLARAPLTGTYTLIVASNDSGHSAIGDYVFTLAKTPGEFVVPRDDQGGPLTNGANHSGKISRGDMDMWSFKAAKDEAISLSIGEDSIPEADPGFWPWFWLIGPDGAKLGESFGALAAQINLTKAPLSGTYTVVVASNDSGHSASGEYLLTLAKTPGAFVVPAGDHGGPMVNGTDYEGAIHRGDLDQWIFFAAKDDSLSIRIGEVLPGEIDPGFWPWIRLRGPDGTLVGESFGALAAQIQVARAPLTGTYTVVVASNDSGHAAAGKYLISTANVGVGQIPYTGADLGGISRSSPGGSPAVTQVGYARIDPDSKHAMPSGMAIFGYRQSGVLVSEAAVPASTLISSGRIYAEVGNAVDTGLAIANPNLEPVTITFYFTDAGGQNFGNGSTTIVSNGQTAKFLSQTPFNSGVMTGTFTFAASQPVSVVALRGLTNERSEFLVTTLPVADLSAAPTKDTLLFPHFADGGGWTTQVVMVNPTDAVMTGSVQFYNQGTATAAAEPAAVTISGQTAGTFAYSIPPRSSRALKTAGSGPAVQVGSIRMIPAAGTNAPSGLGIFNFRNVSEAGVPALPSGKAFRLYVESSGNFNASEIGSMQTGLAIANSSPAATTITFELNSLDGASTGLAGVVNVPGNGQTALFLNQISGFTSLPSRFQGILRVSAPDSLSIVGLRGRYNERGDFLITTTPPVNEASPPTDSTMFFPHIVDGGGYTTQFVLFSGYPGRSSAAAMRLISQTGLVLNWVLQ